MVPDSYGDVDYARYSIRPDAKEKLLERMGLLAAIAHCETENAVLEGVTFKAIKLVEFTPAELGAAAGCKPKDVEELLNGDLASYFSKTAGDQPRYSLARSKILPLIDHFKEASERTQTQVTAYTAQLALTLT